MVDPGEEAALVAQALAAECDRVLRQYAPTLDAESRDQVSRLAAGTCVAALLNDSRVFTTADLAWSVPERLGAVERYCEAFLVDPHEVAALKLIDCLATVDPRYGNASAEYCVATGVRYNTPRKLGAAVTAATRALGSTGDMARDQNRFKSAQRPGDVSELRLTFGLVQAGRVYARRAGVVDRCEHPVAVVLARAALAAGRSEVDSLLQISGRINGIEARRGIALDVLARALAESHGAIEIRSRLGLVDRLFLSASPETFRSIVGQATSRSKGGKRGRHWALAMLMCETKALEAEAWLVGGMAVEELAQRLRSCDAEER